MDDDTYRNRKNNRPKVDYTNEDAYYTKNNEDKFYDDKYTASNAGKPIDDNFAPAQAGELNETTIYRKRKKNKINLVRKSVKKCKCK